MNDRIYQALTAAGLNTSPLSILDHASAYASAFFALYDNELVYHEGGKNSQVPLRDVTRIHSDREGVLRVETSERTAVTASLLGYDPGRVQAFFQQVRDVTARAKELPVLPLNQARPGPVSAPLPATAGGLPTTGMPGLSAYTPAATPPVAAQVQLSPAPSATAPSITAPFNTAPATPVFTPAVQPVPAAQPVPSQNDLEPAAAVIAVPLSTGPSTASASAASSTATSSGATDFGGGSSSVVGAGPLPGRRDVPRPEPVVISSMPPVSDPPAFQERAGERNRQASKAAARTADTLTQLPASPAITSPVNLPSGAHTQGPLVSVPNGAGYDLSSDAQGTATQGTATELLRRADGVQGLARTVGLLAIVLGLAAVALAYFQWQNTGTTTGGTLNAIWTLLAGGVGAVALLAFAEALRLLSALARTSQAAQATSAHSVQNQS